MPVRRMVARTTIKHGRLTFITIMVTRDLACPLAFMEATIRCESASRDSDYKKTKCISIAAAPARAVTLWYVCHRVAATFLGWHVAPTKKPLNQSQRLFALNSVDPRILLVRLANSRLHDFRIPLDGQHNSPLFHAIATAGHDGQHLTFIGHVHSHRK